MGFGARLQLIQLNNRLGETRGIEAFSHLNSFETELLPRIAELFIICPNTELMSWEELVKIAKSVDLDEAALVSISQMEKKALDSLVIASQRGLFAQSFVSNVEHLNRDKDVLDQDFHALKRRMKGEKPVNVRSRYEDKST